jgi:hypothetical protein
MKMVESTVHEDMHSIVSPEAKLDLVGSHKIKPRALVFKANEQDLNNIKEIIETHFPGVEIIYITTGPANCLLRVTKSVPTGPKDNQDEPFYSIE